MSAEAEGKLDGEHFDSLVIGAGMSGLAAGIRLAFFGEKTLVLERHYAVGGLNGFYVKDKRNYDVGLHAMTNFVPAGLKSAPLSRILRQLRVRREDFDLCPQIGSEIHAFGNVIRFDNNFELLESEIARTFPKQIDNFRKLDEYLRGFNNAVLATGEASARERFAEFISDPLLVDTLFLPLSLYGSSVPHDMALAQLAIMWQSIFHEGLARPHLGIRQIINVLQRKLRETGATLRLNCGVKKILTDNGTAIGVELDDGSKVSCKKIFSSAGVTETMRLCEGFPADYGKENIGQISLCETITQLAAAPSKDFGWEQTVVFYTDAESFDYYPPKDFIETSSGTICIPNNYQWREPERAPQEGCIRISSLANYSLWKTLREKDPEQYKREKSIAYEKMLSVALKHLPRVPEEKFRNSILATDVFTPPTIERFTGKLGGALYGAPKKILDGVTPVKNLFICGTDQGFLGITGSMLSGITMASLHALPQMFPPLTFS